jgi:hypothetical protein
MIGHDAI